MRVRRNHAALIFATILFGVGCVGSAPAASPAIILSCEPANDLYRVLQENRVACVRHDTPAQAIDEAPQGAAVMILAAEYPAKITVVPPALFDKAKTKDLRLYVEYPSMLPGMKVGKPRIHKRGPYGSNLDRIVVTSDAFGSALEKTRIVMIQNDHFVPVDAENRHLVVARVAGYDHAIFGLPKDEVWPILFEHPGGNLLVATTKLSHFVTGRYAPTEAWSPVWRMILGWLQPGKEIPDLVWTPTVRPTYGRGAKLPADAELRAFRRGVSWFGRSKLFVEPSGKKGFHEGYNSKRMFLDGSQEVSGQIRGDCHGEVAMALALGAKIMGEDAYGDVSRNLLNLIYRETVAGKGPRLDPESPTYGLIGGDMTNDSGIYYGDDFARRQLGTMAAAVVLDETGWNERAVMDMLAHFRTTGPWGFRTARLEEPEIQARGWEHYWRTSEGRWGGERYRPHYQAYMWSVYLWLYDKTKFKPLLERTRRGIGLMMERFPDRWGSEANRHETERCRMLLPLAWLLRVDDTPEHRRWLQQITKYVLDAQHASGAIPQRVIHETTANQQYGTGECALVQANGDPCTDLLYATNFAFIGLHEAAAVTGDPDLKRAEDRLADFLVRIQVRSETHPELDGTWYRGFDFDKWDYWGSDGDVGWGVWCIETGWTQGWITATLALRHLDTSLWELTAGSKISAPFEKYRRQMLPDDILRMSNLLQSKHAAFGKPITLRTTPHPAYSGPGIDALVDGRMPSRSVPREGCLGWDGKDLDATIDLGQVVPIRSLAIDTLQDTAGGIFLPTQVEFAVSLDGNEFRTVAKVDHDTPPRTPGPLHRVLAADRLDCDGRFVRVVAHNIGKIPAWHHSAGVPAWLFVDEILVNAPKEVVSER